MANNFDKFAILESFLDEVHSYLPEIEASLDRLQQHPDDMEAIEETYRRAHTIAGSAAMMEYQALAHVAQGVEDLLGDTIDRQAPLDAPTIALLRRSFGRLSRLVEHIRSGADDTPIVAEDDADRAAWRGGASSSQAIPLAGRGGPSFADSTAGLSGAATSTPAEATNFEVPGWLAAFAAPTGAQTQQSQNAPDNGRSSGAIDSDRGEEPFGASPPPFMASREPQAATPSSDAIADMPTNHGLAFGASWPSASDSNGFGAAAQPQPTPYNANNERDTSFDEMLQAFQANAAAPQDQPPTQPNLPPMAETPSQNMWSTSSAYPSRSNTYDTFDTAITAAPSQAAAQSYPSSSLPTQSPAPTPMSSPTQLPIDELHADVEAVRRQVGSLHDVLGDLREAAQAMEDERGELRTFLDGSRDALERLEEWAGQQMGLDLRHSPESVRRYLPLSVIWVTTTRLKKLVSLLNNSSRGLIVRQEEIEETLAELQRTIDDAGHIYNSAATISGAPGTGFTATVAQITWDPPAAAPPQPEAQPDRWRQSSVQAFAASQSQPMSAATRAEIERNVREQLRRELEDDVRAEVAAEVRHDEEDRLRQELQIQVRRQLLSELAPEAGAGAHPMPIDSAVQVSEFMPFMASHKAEPVQVTSEQSPEALEVFRDEAQEHLQTITTSLSQLEKTPGDRDVLQSIRRAMHTLKGAAGMMGFSTIQHIAHASEDLLDRLVEGAISFSSDVLSLLLDTSEGLDQLVRDARLSPEDQQQILRALTARYARITGIEAPGAVGDFAHSDATQITVVDEADEGAEVRASTGTPSDLSVRLQLSKLDDLVNLFGELLINRSVLEERIDRLNRLVADTVTVGERLRDVGSQLETRFEAATLPSGRASGTLTLNGRGRDPAASWAPGVQRGLGTGGLGAGKQEIHAEFDELELDRYTEFHRLSRGLSEGVADAVTLSHEMEALIRECQTSFMRENRLSSDFQDRLLKARLVPLQSLVPRLYRVARASALKEGKEIEFFAEGTGTEVDRKVFEEVAGPLLHLVRNAVNHGIERSNVREMAGKPRAGKILLSAAYEGNQVVISVRDDGAGIDPEHVRETAIARGWIDAYTPLSEKEAINLIFQQGVTTAETITEESGRGVGLDVVRDTVARLRGTIEVESQAGEGTVFTMKLPISLQIARAVLVKVGQQTLAIPMAVVEQIGRLDYYQRAPGASPAIELHGERYPLAHLASYLRLQQGPIEERASVLLVNAGKRRVAVLVDSIVAQQEVVSKPLGPHLREVRGVAGAAVLGNGQVVLILELTELLAQQPHGGELVLPELGSHSRVTQIPTSHMPTIAAAPPSAARTAGSSASIPAMPQRPMSSAPSMPAPEPTLRRDFVVAPRSAADPAAMAGNAQRRVVVPPVAKRSYLLVVDDSPSVRRVVSNMLKAHDWEVQTARDGVEALEVVARQVPAAVLLDIEMPRMDGYELMATIRSQEQYRSLPLIVLTSRAATKHQQRALQLGADAYVVKPYQDEELLNTIATLVQGKR